MLVCYGFPKVFRAETGRDEPWIFIGQDVNYIVAVSASAVQLWSAGLHRVRLSQVVRSSAEIADEGQNICAHYSPSKATLAVLVSATGLILLHLLATSHLQHADLSACDPRLRASRMEGVLGVDLHAALQRAQGGHLPAQLRAARARQPADDHLWRQPIHPGWLRRRLRRSARMVRKGAVMHAFGVVFLTPLRAQVRDISLLLYGEAATTPPMSNSSSWAGQHPGAGPQTVPAAAATLMQLQQPDQHAVGGGSAERGPSEPEPGIDAAAEPVVLSHTSLNLRPPSQYHSAGGGDGGAAASEAAAALCPPIVDMHFCERSRALALVLADGSAALCGGAGEANPLVRASARYHQREGICKFDATTESESVRLLLVATCDVMSHASTSASGWLVPEPLGGLPALATRDLRSDRLAGTAAGRRLQQRRGGVVQVSPPPFFRSSA